MRRNTTRCVLALILFCLCAVPAEAGDKPAETSQSPTENYIIAYYFHGNYRCANCNKIESYSRDAIQTTFKDELQKGLLHYTVVNMELPENRHFITDYQLYTKSLVLVLFKDGKEVAWKNLPGVWQFLKNPDMFYSYVTDEVKRLLKKL